MTIKELIFLGKNLVVEYNKKFKEKKYDIEEDKFVPNKNLTVEQVQIKETSETSDGILEIVLIIKDDPWWQYRIIYNPNNKEENMINTIIEMT